MYWESEGGEFLHPWRKGGPDRPRRWQNHENLNQSHL